jgi:tRNA threonylcarbamoyladenosine biosynthesis protein TsaB
LLVIDCATEACSVALFEGTQLIGGAFAMLGRGHAEKLIPMIEALPGNGRAQRIAVDAGPGSFTGIRVGLAAARALALAWDAAVEGYSSLALVAAMAREQHPGQAIDAVMNGGHGEWFFQAFDESGDARAPGASMSPEAAAAASRAPLIAGSQAEALAALRGAGQPLPLWPDARALGALPAAALRPDPLAAYGRAPDAQLPGAPALVAPAGAAP